MTEHSSTSWKSLPSYEPDTRNLRGETFSHEILKIFRTPLLVV